LLSSWISLVLFLTLYGLFSAGELPQGVFGKDATAEFDPFVHQLKHTFSASTLIAVTSFEVMA